MDRCNCLCTKDATGYCALCEARAEADRFWRFWFQGGLFIDGVRALTRVEGRDQDAAHRSTLTLIIMQDGLKQFSSFSEDASKVLRFCALLSTVFGAYYFLAYMIYHGLPFPLELTILPTILLVIGIGSILFTSLAILYLFLAALVHWDPLNVDYPVLIYTNFHGIFAPSGMVLLANWVLMYGGPISIWLLLVFQELFPTGKVGVYLTLIGFLIWAILFGVAKVQVAHSRLGRSKWITALKISVTTFCVLLLGSFSTVLFILVLHSRDLLETVGRQLYASLIFLYLALMEYVQDSMICHAWHIHASRTNPLVSLSPRRCGYQNETLTQNMSITSSIPIMGYSCTPENRHVPPEAMSIIGGYRQVRMPLTQREIVVFLIFYRKVECCCVA